MILPDRICRTKTTDSINIFDVPDSENILMKISYCCGIKVKSNNVLPKMMCLDCLNLLDSAFQFKQLAIESNTFFEKLLRHNCIVEVTNTSEINQYFAHNELEKVFVSSWCSLQNVNETNHIDEYKTQLCTLSDSYKFDERLDSKTLIEHEEYDCDNDVNFDEKINIDELNKVSPETRSNRLSSDEPLCTLQVKLESNQDDLNKYNELNSNENDASDDQDLKGNNQNEFKQFKEAVKNKGLEKEVSEFQDIIKTLTKSWNAVGDRKKNINKVKSSDSNERHKKKKSILSKTSEKTAKVKRIRGKSHPDTCIACVTCGAMVKQSQLREHKLSHLPPLACTFCSYSTPDKQLFHRHLCEAHIAGQDKPFSCSECLRKFKSQVVLDQHMRHTHRKGDRKRLYKKPTSGAMAPKKPDQICDICGLVMSFPKLAPHRLTHFPKGFKCDTCGKSYYTKLQLEKHNQVAHLGKSEYMCEICGRALRCASHLRYHVENSHSQTLKYGCHICGQGFASLLKVKGHIRLHYGGGRKVEYTCRVCGLKKRKHRYAMDEHMLKAHGISTKGVKHSEHIDTQRAAGELTDVLREEFRKIRHLGAAEAGAGAKLFKDFPSIQESWRASAVNTATMGPS